MPVRRLIALCAFVLLAPLASACTSQGPGTTTNCDLTACTVTFARGVDAKASILGVEAKLLAVDGNMVTLEVAGQKVTVPVGETQPADGRTVTVQEVTSDKVVVRIATGLTSG
ncbi:hypothetical protein NDR87_22010 [Nocardia sp. CDC159]|uniref:Uncharacterized protein n=1 Tax=Nocardia pulmonis TaxID=2951408 RepID=A0A9X2EC72_9NOCA|nr:MULTISPECIES: hypothetical protein [Nocardia]MCM6776805.1 hypothetical protein [Nocardia pulmonis]MCM6789046.1 hypothetical protein [Nocardia sp. CDC159]